MIFGKNNEPLDAEARYFIKKHPKGISEYNPYTLVAYRLGWSESKTTRNNNAYWAWEVLFNNLTLP